MLSLISAILLYLEKKRALVQPHVIQHVADKITGNGHQRDKMSFARWLALFDTPIHLLVLGHIATQLSGQIDSGKTCIGRPLFGNMFSMVEGGAGEVLTGGDAQEARHMLAVGEATGTAQLTNQGQGIANASPLGGLEQYRFRSVRNEGKARLQKILLSFFGLLNIGHEMKRTLADNLATDSSTG